MKKEKISFSIIGASAMGMPAANLLTRYFSIEKIALIDSDIWESEQLYKHISSQQKHTGKSKVKVARDMIKAYNPKINVIPVQFTAQHCKAQQVMRKTKYWILCVDNDTTRLDMQILAAEHKKFLIDLSAQIIGKERIGTVRLYIPKKTPCIVCQGLNLSNIMTDTLREARTKTGYLVNSRQNPRSVAVLDTATASIGISLLIDYLNGKKGDLPTTLSYNQTNHEITKLTFKKRRNCKICRLLEKEK